MTVLKSPTPNRELRAKVTSPPVLWAAGLTLVAIAVRAPFMGSAISALDTVDYLLRAEELLNGEGFRDALRTPGLPILLAGLKSIGTNPIVAVVVIQNIIGILMPAALMLFGWRYFNRIAGVVAGFLAAASPLLVFTEQYALTDYLFGIALSVGAGLLIEGVMRIRLERSSWRWLVAAGAALGIATMIRGNGQYVFIAVPIALLFTVRGWRSVLTSSAVTLAAAAAVIAPWVLHNMVSYNTPQVTTLGGVSLYLRTIDHDRVLPPGDTREARLARYIYRDTYAYAPAEEERSSGNVFAEALTIEGYSNARVSSIMSDIAVEAIRRDPSLYLTNTWDIFREYRSMYNPSGDPAFDQIGSVESSLANPPPGLTFEGRDVRPGESDFTRGPWELAQTINGLAYLLSFGGLLVLALPFFGPMRSRVASTVLLTFVLLGWLTGALSIHFEPRFGLPFAFMGWLLMAVAAVAVARVVVGAGASVGRRALSSNVIHELRYTEGNSGDDL
jgi:4-amino-4-deoxy-L-arabinose transferase-like glycosyltransferase